MFCKTTRSCCPFSLIIIAALVLICLKPAEWLVHKPASADASYGQGWSDGCHSGANAASPWSVLLDKPFTKQVTENAKAVSSEKKTAIAVDNYQYGWNDGFTLCRFSQAAFEEWGQFLLLLAALIAVGRWCVKASQ